MENTKKLRFCYEKDILNNDYQVKFLLQEFMTGGSICDAIADMSDAELLDMLIQLLFQLEYFHKVIKLHHGDLHVNNVMNTNDTNFDAKSKKYYRYTYIDTNKEERELYIPVKDRIFKIIDFDKSFDLEGDTQTSNELSTLIEKIYDNATNLGNMFKNKTNINFNNDYSNENVTGTIITEAKTYFEDMMKDIDTVSNLITQQDFLTPNLVDNFYTYKNIVIEANTDYVSVITNIVSPLKNITSEMMWQILEAIGNNKNIYQVTIAIELSIFRTRLSTINKNISKYSIFHLEQLIQTQGDYIFILKSIYKSLQQTQPINYLLDEDISILVDRKELTSETQISNVRNAYIRFRDMSLTNEQFCKETKAKEIYQLVGKLLNVAASVGTMSVEEGVMNTRFKLDTNGQLIQDKTNLENGNLSSFMYLINDYLNSKNFYNKPTDGEIIDAISLQ